MTRAANKWHSCQAVSCASSCLASPGSHSWWNSERWKPTASFPSPVRETATVPHMKTKLAELFRDLSSVFSTTRWKSGETSVDTHRGLSALYFIFFKKRTIYLERREASRSFLPGVTQLICSVHWLKPSSATKRWATGDECFVFFALHAENYKSKGRCNMKVRSKSALKKHGDALREPVKNKQKKHCCPRLTVLPSLPAT